MCGGCVIKKLREFCFFETQNLNLKRVREARLNVTDKKQLFDGMKSYFDQVLKTYFKTGSTPKSYTAVFFPAS